VDIPIGHIVDTADSDIAPAAWKAIVTADRVFYQQRDSDVPFPGESPEREITLTAPTVLIGRHSRSRGHVPDIDLTGSTQDPGVSRIQALLQRESDGTYTITDPNSTNGVLLNDDPNPLPPGVTVPLHDGDRIYCGLWTRIMIRAG